MGEKAKKKKKRKEGKKEQEQNQPFATAEFPKVINDRQKAWADLLLKRPQPPPTTSSSETDGNLNAMSDWIQEVLAISDLSGLGLDDTSSSSIMKLITASTPVSATAPSVSSNKGASNGQGSNSNSIPASTTSAKPKTVGKGNITSNNRLDSKNIASLSTKIKKSSVKKSSTRTSQKKKTTTTMATKTMKSPIKRMTSTKSMKKNKRKGRGLPPKKLIMQSASNDENSTGEDEDGNISNKKNLSDTDSDRDDATIKEPVQPNVDDNMVEDDLPDDATTSSEESVDLRVQKRQKR